jgi:hypothetical protein
MLPPLFLHPLYPPTQKRPLNPLPPQPNHHSLLTAQLSKTKIQILILTILMVVLTFLLPRLPNVQGLIGCFSRCPRPVLAFRSTHRTTARRETACTTCT